MFSCEITRARSYEHTLIQWELSFRPLKNRFVSANTLKSKRVGRRNFLFYFYFFLIILWGT